MAEITRAESLLIVPQGAKPLPDSFLNFLWDHEVKAFLVKPEWVGEPESGPPGWG